MVATDNLKNTALGCGNSSKEFQSSSMKGQGNRVRKVLKKHLEFGFIYCVLWKDQARAMNPGQKGEVDSWAALENSTVEGRKDGDELCVVI